MTTNKKQMGDITVKNDYLNGFVISKKLQGNNYEKLVVPYSIELEKAFENSNATPFISALQKRSQKSISLHFKKQYDERLNEIRKKFKRKGLKNRVTKYSLKKALHAEAERVRNDRKVFLDEKFAEIESHKEEITAKYQDCKIETKENGMKLNHLKDGTTLVLDILDKMKDKQMGFASEEIDENTEWEIYGKTYTEKESEKVSEDGE